MREKELRLALICYGGISLAVYMHGITKEIWHLVRASHGHHAGGGRGTGSLAVDWVYSRVAPEGPGRPAGRLTRDELERLVLPASEHPLVYVCGANSFVAAVAGWLVELGHAPTRVRTERFGGV